MENEELDEIVRCAQQAVASGHPTDEERAIAELSERLQRFQLADLAARQGDIVDKPSKDDIAAFLKVFDDLCRFEAASRAIRGYGVFDPAMIPIASCVRVRDWLRSVAQPNS